MRYIVHPKTGELIPRGEYFASREAAGGITVIRDIEPYRAVASDVRAGGKAPVITGRADHREFLRVNNYIEIGNETQRPFTPNYDVPGRADDIRKAMAKHGI